MNEILQIISLVISITTGCFTLAITTIKPFRKWLLCVRDERKQKEQEEVDRKETDKCLLRDRIVSTYYKYCHDCEIRQYEFENVEKLYTQYKKLGGNSFVDHLWEQMKEWQIIR